MCILVAFLTVHFICKPSTGRLKIFLEYGFYMKYKYLLSKFNFKFIQPT